MPDDSPLIERAKQMLRDSAEEATKTEWAYGYEASLMSLLGCFGVACIHVPGTYKFESLADFVKEDK